MLHGQDMGKTQDTVGGPLGLFLRAVPNKKKLGFLRTPLGA